MCRQRKARGCLETMIRSIRKEVDVEGKQAVGSFEHIKLIMWSRSSTLNINGHEELRNNPNSSLTDSIREMHDKDRTFSPRAEPISRSGARSNPYSPLSSFLNSEATFLASSFASTNLCAISFSCFFLSALGCGNEILIISGLSSSSRPSKTTFAACGERALWTSACREATVFGWCFAAGCGSGLCRILGGEVRVGRTAILFWIRGGGLRWLWRAFELVCWCREADPDSGIFARWGSVEL